MRRRLLALARLPLALAVAAVYGVRYSWERREQARAFMDIACRRNDEIDRLP